MESVKIDPRTMNVVDAYFGIHFTGKIEMPCGEKFLPTGQSRKCAKSGNCPKGHKECWLEKYVEIPQGGTNAE